MSLKMLANGSTDVEQKLKLLRQRQKDIELGDYFTAFTMDRIRREKNKKLRGKW